MLRKIVWKNIVYKPLNTALCVGLLLFGVGIISLLLLIQHQLEQKFARDLQNIDLVVGAKGSPLQLVLSAVYHLDAPTGNIKLADARKIMSNPMIQEAIPMAYGDSYQGYRILGTTEAYLKKYDAQLREGHLFSKAMQATIGSNIAEKTGLRVGDTFLGTHGEVKGGHVHEDHPYTVVGILQPTNTVLDNLVLTKLESVWQVHTPPDTEQLPQDTELALNQGHEHSSPVSINDSMEITALLLRCKTKIAILNIPRIINEQTNMQAVLPTLEINRLFHMMGIGGMTLKMIAGGIMGMAGFSIFFVLYNRLRERKFELALLRTVGYRPWQLFRMLVLEGLILAIVGYVLGWLFSRVGLYVVNQQAKSDFNLYFSSEWIVDEAWLLLLTIMVGVGAALLPALQAMRMNISAVLSEN
ncbi:MAG: ABC transporter permease [Chitinophagales bacterium]|nr:ABC transporter permease [Chitinophagales bacterium]